VNRREFITLLGGAAAASYASWPLAARAQQSGQVRMAESDARVQTRIAAFKARVHKVGWPMERLTQVQRQFGLMSASLTIFSHTPS
jgi:hypothetical protein